MYLSHQFIAKRKVSIPEYQKEWITQLESSIIREISNPNLKILDLAIEHRISERQLYREVKNILGMTPNSFIRSIKMELARDAILKGKYATISELAYSLGYNRSDYFVALFTKHHGYRPMRQTT